MELSMTVPGPALDEKARLAALYACAILDTLPESAFDDLVELAYRACGTAVAAISFIDSDRQWLKAWRGPAVGVAREHAFCNHTIQGTEILVVPDATQDGRFRENPYVVGDFGVRFYAGVPLVTSEGARVGSLCVVDVEPRQLTSEQQTMLEILARQIGAQLELRRQKAALEEALAARDVAVKRLGLVYDLQRCVAEARDLSEALSTVVARLGEALEFAAGGVWLVPLDGGAALANAGGYWLSSPGREAFRDASLSTRFTREVGILGLAWRRGTAVWLDQLIDEPGLPRLTASLASGLSSGVAVPLSYEGEPVAVLELFSSVPRRQDDDTSALLAHVATDLGGLIRRRQQHDRLHDTAGSRPR